MTHYIVLKYQEHVKDLSRLAHHLRWIVIINGIPFTFLQQPLNGIPCVSFTWAHLDDNWPLHIRVKVYLFCEVGVLYIESKNGLWVSRYYFFHLLEFTSLKIILDIQDFGHLLPMQMVTTLISNMWWKKGWSHI